MKFLIILLSLLIIINFIKVEGTIHNQNNTARPNIHLNESNFVAIRGVIDFQSEAQFINDILSIKGKTIYIHINSPGGSVTSGNNMIQVMESLIQNGKQIICIADFAASMGFVLFQSCPTRYVMDHSIIMQHQMSLGVEGPIEQVRTLFNLIEKFNKKAQKMQALRLNMGTTEFQDKIKHDWWLYSEEIIEENAADAMVNVLCDFNTDKSYNITKQVLFWEVNIEFSLCPLIRKPRKISINVEEININKKLIELVDNNFKENPYSFDKEFKVY